MSNFGIEKVRYKPICSSEEMELEIKIPSANEVVKNMWNKLDDTEKGFINIMIDKNNKQDLEIERLNNIIKEVIEYLEPIELISIKGKMKQDLLNILKGSDKE